MKVQKFFNLLGLSNYGGKKAAITSCLSLEYPTSPSNVCDLPGQLLPFSRLGKHKEIQQQHRLTSSLVTTGMSGTCFLSLAVFPLTSASQPHKHQVQHFPTWAGHKRCPHWELSWLSIALGFTHQSSLQQSHRAGKDKGRG